MSKTEQLEVCRTCTNYTCNDCSDNKFVSLIRKSVHNVNCLCPLDEEPYFGKAPCMCCGDELAGQRYKFTGSDNKTGQDVEFTACVDCFGYLFI